LLREERQKIKQIEIAEKLEKKRVKKISKKRRKKKNRKAKKRKTVKIESSPAEVDKTPSPTVSSEAWTVAETFSEAAPAPAKSHGFHIPSF